MTDGIREAENTLIRMAAGIKDAETVVCIVIDKSGRMDYLRHGPDPANGPAPWVNMVGALHTVATLIVNEKVLPNRVDYE